MIEIKTPSGEIIELDKSEVTIELNNSLFNDGSKLSGSLSYPIDVSFSKRNKLLLGYAQAVESGVKATSLQVYAKIGGKSFRKCTMKVNIGDRAFDCNLEIDLGAINNYNSVTKLHQVPFETYHLGTDTTDIETAMMEAAVNLDWRECPYTFFPVRNPGFTGSSSSLPTIPPVFSGDPDNPVRVNDPFATTGELINSVRIESGAVKFNVQSPWDTKGRYHTTPFFYLGYILDRISSALGFVMKGDFATHQDISRVVVYNVNDTFITRDGTFGYLPEEQQGIFISAADHLPDITISDFFKILVSYFGIRITADIDAGELNFSWKKSTFDKPTFKDWSKKLIRIRKQEFEISDGYVLTAEVDKLDESKDPGVESVTVGTGKDKIEIKAGALRTAEESMLDSEYQWKIPNDNRSGNIVDPLFEGLGNYKPFEQFNSFPVRFLMSSGLATFGSNPIPYPKGTTEGTEISLSLASIYQYSIKPWFSRTYAAKTATASFNLTPADICELKDSDIILLKGENGTTVQALFQKLSFTTKGEYHLATEADLIILDSAYIREQPDTGIFVKITESNEETEEVDNGSGSIPLGGTWLRKYSVTTVDLQIKLYSDRSCSLELNDPDLLVYLKISKLENWINLYYKQAIPVYVVDREENQTYDRLEYKKIYFTSSSVTLPGVVKRSTYRFDLKTSDVAKINVITVTSNNSFTIQADDNYLIAE